jgi:hypothetical protein
MRKAGLAALLLAVASPAAALQWQESVEIATGRGERGPWRQNDSRYDYVDDPAVALSDDGRPAVAWVDQGAKDVFFEGVNVSRSPDTFSWLPRIALQGKDVYVLWQEILFTGGSHGGDILFARSQDGGRTFSEPLNLSERSPAGDGKGRITKDLWHNGSLDLALGKNGAVYAAWTEYEGALWFRRSTDQGATFAAPVRVDEGGAARAPSLAVVGGTLYLAWTDGDVHVAASTNSGKSFNPPVQVTSSRAYSDAPKLAVDAAGVLHLAYAEDARIRYTHSRDGGRTFERARALSRPGAGFPALGIAGNDDVCVAWEMFPDGARRRPRGLALTVSRDGGVVFTPPEPIPGSADPAGAPNGSFQGLLMQKMAVDRRGDVAVVNSSLQDGKRSRVWLMRGVD